MCQTPLEQGALTDEIDEGAAELALVGALNLAAQRRTHGLLAVTDAEHGQAHLEPGGIRARRLIGRYRRRAAGKDQRTGLERRDFAGIDVVRSDLAINPILAHPAGDQLSQLGAKIEDEDAIGHACLPVMTCKSVTMGVALPREWRKTAS